MYFDGLYYEQYEPDSVCFRDYWSNLFVYELCVAILDWECDQSLQRMCSFLHTLSSSKSDISLYKVFDLWLVIFNNVVFWPDMGRITLESNELN